MRVFTNHKPTVSAKIRTMMAKAICISKEVEKTLLRASKSPRPSSNVKKRPAEWDKAPDIRENIPTNPPTTL